MTAETKWTPLVWRVDGTTVYAVTSNDEHKKVNKWSANVQANSGRLGASREELVAIASLMAMAPEMYEILEYISCDESFSRLPETMQSDVIEIMSAARGEHR